MVFWEFHVPRLCSALLAGSGLALSGLLMQNVFQNPMAGPYVLGVNSGASLLIAIVILGANPWLMNQLSYVGAAMLGAFLAAGAFFATSFFGFSLLTFDFVTFLPAAIQMDFIVSPKNREIYLYFSLRFFAS